MTALSETAGLNATEIMHRRFSTLDASVTVGEVRAYFAESTSRRLALLAEGERFAGAISDTTIPDTADEAEPAVGFAVRGPTVTPDAPADRARDLALESPSKRLAVVDDAGHLVGIVAIDSTQTRFCGT